MCLMINENFQNYSINLKQNENELKQYKKVINVKNKHIHTEDDPE